MSKAVVAEQRLTFAVSVEDLKGLLPRTYRKMVEDGATFTATVTVPTGGDYSGGTLDLHGPGADTALTLSVFTRTAK